MLNAPKFSISSMSSFLLLVYNFSMFWGLGVMVQIFPNLIISDSVKVVDILKAVDRNFSLNFFFDFGAIYSIPRSKSKSLR